MLTTSLAGTSCAARPARIGTRSAGFQRAEKLAGVPPGSIVRPRPDIAIGGDRLQPWHRQRRTATAQMGWTAQGPSQTRGASQQLAWAAGRSAGKAVWIWAAMDLPALFSPQV